MRSKLFSLLSAIRLIGLGAAAFSMWGFAAIASNVLTQETHAIDLSILLTLRNLHRPILDQIMIGLTFLGQPSLLLVLCLCLGAVLTFSHEDTVFRTDKSEATTIAIAATGAVGLNAFLKSLFARTRPQLWERVVDVRFYSFPSGHAMTSFVIYGLLGYLLARRFPQWRWFIATVTVLLIMGIGFSRLYLGVHWPTDVIAGYTAGLVWLITCILTLEIWQELWPALPKQKSVSESSEEEFLPPE